MNLRFRPLAISLVALLFSGLFLARAQAGGGSFFPPVADPVVREECGSCHLAFPPAMLPASSWIAIMGGLKNHFGDDASVDAATAALITRYLSENAADRAGQRYAGKLTRGVDRQTPPLRITELPGWIKKHREVSAKEWKRSEVGSKANCAACHRDAQRGYFED